MTSLQLRGKRHRSGKVWIIVLVLLGLLGGSAYGWYRIKGSGYSQNVEAPVTQKAFRGPFDHVVLEQGEIESSSNVEVKCEVKGKGTSGTPILWVIDEGAYIKKGDLVVKLDSSALESEYKSQRITLNAADAAVISSDALVRQSIIARQEYIEGTYETERKAILSEIAVAEQDLRKAELSLASAERLAAKGALKSLQIEAEQFAVKNASNQLDAAKGRLNVLENLTKEKMLVQFNSDIEKNKAKLDSDKNTAIEEKSKLDEIQQQITACMIRSPNDGQVVYKNKYSGRGGSEFLVEPGAMVREQQTIIVLPDAAQMQVKAKINESRITLVTEGMAAKIKVNAVQGDLLGQVTKVNKYAEQGSWFSSSVKEYATYVRIQDPPPNIRTGMTAEVRIFVEQLADALQIPVSGVYEIQDHQFVLVKNGDKWDTKEIKIAATNDKFVTVASGVNEGDEIVLNPRNHLDLMDIPKDIESKSDDRAKLQEISKQAIPKKLDPEGAPTSGAPPKAGKPGGGGPGGMSSDAIAEMAIQRTDTDTDGKISKAEAENSETLKKNFDTNDANHDGFIDKTEMSSAIKKQMNQMGGAGGPPRG